jgi:hypothetical protein
VAIEATDTVEADHRPWWLRLRSAVVLVVMVVGIGVVVAAVLGLLVLAVTTVLDQALG